MYTKHEEIRLLIEETIRHLEKSGKKSFRDKQIFARVLGDTPEMRDAFYEFLHDVSTCPPEVLRWCQEQVNISARSIENPSE